MCRRENSVVTVTPVVVFLLMSMLFCLTSMCVTQSDPPFSGLSFPQTIWTNTNLTWTKGTVVSAIWFIMNWCIKVIFRLQSSMLTLSNALHFLLYRLPHAKVLPLWRTFHHAYYVQSLYKQCILSEFLIMSVLIHCLQFSVCISCCLKCRISTKVFVFVHEQEVL